MSFRAPYCVPLPATMKKRNFTFLVKESNLTAWTDEQQKTLNDVLEQIGVKSIFHSAEQLAG